MPNETNKQTTHRNRRPARQSRAAATALHHNKAPAHSRDITQRIRPGGVPSRNHRGDDANFRLHPTMRPRRKAAMGSQQILEHTRLRRPHAISGAKSWTAMAVSHEIYHPATLGAGRPPARCPFRAQGLRTDCRSLPSWQTPTVAFMSHQTKNSEIRESEPKKAQDGGR